MINRCEYCGQSDSLSRIEDSKIQVYVCPKCWVLLKRPETALPLIRGHLSLLLRGRIQEDKLKRMVDKFIQSISSMKPKN